ncbi:MAG: choice-of-anchor B family protein [Gammaproteobacteria bacterium]|nr:choice-of-anchor B family protein [Gammaproteobacteria bacterium]
MNGAQARAAGSCVIGLALSVTPVSSHNDTLGARFVAAAGADATECLQHHEPCASIQYALGQARPGNTIKVSAGTYDVTGVDPESFLFGAIRAQGGYEPGGHFVERDRHAYPTILVGVDRRYRQQLMHLGFKWAADLTSAREGMVDDSPAPALQATARQAEACVQGEAGQFPCRNVDFLAQIALEDFSTQPFAAANVWGYVDQNDGREYAIVGLGNGTAVVDLADPENPREVVTIPGPESSWREVKVYQHFDAGSNRYRAYAYVTTEASGAGLQVIDLSGLPVSATLATTLSDTGSQHTAYVSNIDYATNIALPGTQAYLYLAGSNVNGGAWRAYSLASPSVPQLVATAPAGTQYVHDATSLLITDARTAQCAAGHDPCEVYVDFNENTVDLWDVTDKTAPVMLSSTTYSDASYTHSGWPTADQRHIFVHDETEELFGGLRTQIYTMSVEDLRNPFIIASYQGPDTTTDHNGYVRNGFLYVSHYRRGLVVFDAADPERLREVASFDTFLAPGANVAGTDGAWGVYPFFPSGIVVVSDINNGLFVLRDHAATLAQQVGQLGFAVPAAGAEEGAGDVELIVRRSGGTLGAVTIDYSTADATATAGSDYTAASGTLSWGDGDMGDKVITISLIDDSEDEEGESFEIRLANAGGGAALDGAASLTVNVADNDSTVTPPPGGRGGGGAPGVELLWLCGLLLLSALAQHKSGSRADDRSDQVRLGNHRHA